MHAKTQLPSLSVLRSFEAAAKHQSFTLAAEELRLTQGAISRQVRELEEHIGTPMFRRVGRGVRLTDAGKLLADRLAGDLDQLRQTIAHCVAAGEGARVLALGVLPTFGARWLVPRLASFKDVHPGIELILYSRSQPFDLIQEGIDAAVHFGRAEWPGAQLTPLCPEDPLVVASPEFTDRYASITSLDFHDVPLLHLTSRPDLWDVCRETYAQDGMKIGAGTYFDQFSMVIAAAINGLGAAILPRYLIEGELASGALVMLAGVPNKRDDGYYIATPLGATSNSATDFINWIRKQVSRRHFTAA